MLNKVAYKESLPDSCPPSTAVSASGKFVRFVAKPTVTENCFKSFAALGAKPRAHVNECVWAACSLVAYDVTDEDPLRTARDFAKLKGISKHKKYAAVITLSPNDGVLDGGNSGGPHYSFWMYTGYDPSNATVEPL